MVLLFSHLEHQWLFCCRPRTFWQSTVLLHPREAVTGVEARARKEVRSPFMKVGPVQQILSLSTLRSTRGGWAIWDAPLIGIPPKGSFCTPVNSRAAPPSLCKLQSGTFVSWRQFRSRVRQMPSAGFSLPLRLHESTQSGVNVRMAASLNLL